MKKPRTPRAPTPPDKPVKRPADGTGAGNDAHADGTGTPIRKARATMPPSSGSSGAKKG